MLPATAQKILIVDDVPDTRLFISNMLSSHGYSPVFAETRTEGFRRAVAENPSVIIIDMMIPNEGGIRFYRDLKRNPHLNRIPVIMLSTIARKTFFKWHKTLGAEADLKRSGTDIYLGMPPEAEELLLAVKKLSDADFPKRQTAMPSVGSPSLNGKKKSDRTTP